jgi:hypothetical protein
MVDCNEKAICNEPLLCLKAYLLCRKRWMKKKLERLESETPYARFIVGETAIPEERGGLPSDYSAVPLTYKTPFSPQTKQ